MARPKKTDCSVGLDEMLRLGMPNKRTKARITYYRMAVRDDFIWENHRKPTEEEIDQKLAAARAGSYDQGEVERFKSAMRGHLPIFESEIRQNRSKKAAAKRWKN
jgi:hypothetical protein